MYYLWNVQAYISGFRVLGWAHLGSESLLLAIGPVPPHPSLPVLLSSDGTDAVWRTPHLGCITSPWKHHHCDIVELCRHNVHVCHAYTLYITWCSYLNRCTLDIATSNYSRLAACILPRPWRRTLATAWDLLRHQRQYLVRWRRAFCSRGTPESSNAFEYSCFTHIRISVISN